MLALTSPEPRERFRQWIAKQYGDQNYSVRYICNKRSVQWNTKAASQPCMCILGWILPLSAIHMLRSLEAIALLSRIYAIRGHGLVALRRFPGPKSNFHILLTPRPSPLNPHHQLYAYPDAAHFYARALYPQTIHFLGLIPSDHSCSFLLRFAFGKRRIQR